MISYTFAVKILRTINIVGEIRGSEKVYVVKNIDNSEWPLKYIIESKIVQRYSFAFILLYFTALTSLPSFKRQLKTFLFTKSFPSV